MSEFKPMVKMYTDEPSVSLKLKKGGKVHVKGKKEEHGHKGMHQATGSMMHGAHHAFESEHGKSPKKPSIHERMKAMNPNFKKGGKVAHKVMGGGMPMGAQQAPMGAQQAPMGGAPMAPMANPALAQMSPQQRAQRAMMVRKALTGMKKGGMCEEKDIKKLEKELQHHEKLDMKHAHPMKKASGGAIDKDETKTTIKGNAKKFEKTKVNDGEHHDKHHGIGEIKEGKPAGYKHGGHLKHKFATGGAIPADTYESKNKGKTKFGGTIEDNEGSYLETEMHSAKKDKAHGTGGIKESNAGGFKHGGHAHKMHHKATGGAIPAATEKSLKEGHLKQGTVEGGDWEDRPADTSTAGKKNGKTGQVNESNAGGFKHGGHASKKAYATGGDVDMGQADRSLRQSPRGDEKRTYHVVNKSGKAISTHGSQSEAMRGAMKDLDNLSVKRKYASGGNVVNDGKAVKMPRHFLSQPVANSLQSGTFKKGGKVRFAEGGSEDMSNGAYDAHYANEKKENEAMRNAVTSIPKRLYEGAKSLFSSPKSPESVTKTEKSVTVTPAKRRGGSMKC